MNNYKKVKVQDTFLGEPETNTKFNHPSVNKKYIRVLATCLTYAPAKIIYPNVKNPVMKQVRDLCRAGYLDRYAREDDHKYYYKTTRKGMRLLAAAVK